MSSENRQYKDIDGVLFAKDGKTLHAYPAGNARTVYTIPAGVTTIGDSAFSGCESLTAITIPVSVTSIGVEAFSYCESLKPELRADIERRFGENVFADPGGA